MNINKSLSLLLMTSAVACAQESDERGISADEALGPGEVAIVGDARIPESVFRLYTLNTLQTNVENLSPDDRGAMIQRLINMQLLATEARNKGVDTERRVAAELELQRVQALARQMAARFAEENPPTEFELREMYEANLEQLQKTRYQTRHILVDDEELAEDLIDDIQDGDDFAELAREHSTDGSAERGGDLGWMTPDGVVEPFGDAMLSATPGEVVSTPIQTQYGWHVILIEEIEENAAPGIAAVREDLIVAVEQQKLAVYLEQLRESQGVTITQ